MFIWGIVYRVVEDTAGTCLNIQNRPILSHNVRGSRTFGSMVSRALSSFPSLVRDQLVQNEN